MSGPSVDSAEKCRSEHRDAALRHCRLEAAFTTIGTATLGGVWRTTKKKRPRRPSLPNFTTLAHEPGVISSISLPAAIRRPANNGDDSLTVEVMGGDAPARITEIEQYLTDLVPRLPELTDYALNNAPAEWRAYFVDGPGAEENTGLWLDTVTFEADGRVCLCYDYGVLGMIVLTLAADGRREVTHED